MSTTGLVPDEYSDFRTKKFWEGFFEARDGKTFEWYGDWTTLGPLITKTCTADGQADFDKGCVSVLVPGCGNSAISGDLYDSGFTQVTNVDFSPTCIKEMLRGNVRSRPLMKWQVMDMTAMKFGARAFDVVLDKGSLDALMGDAEDDEGTQSGMAFLREVKRVLRTSAVNSGGGCSCCSAPKPSGVAPAYVVVTLCQEHVLETILHAFSLLARDNQGPRTDRWQVTLSAIPQTKDMRDSPWQPFAIVARRGANADAAAAAMQEGAAKTPEEEDGEELIDITLDFGGRRQAAETEQMAEVRRVVRDWKVKAKLQWAAGRALREESRRLEASLQQPHPGQRILLNLPQHVQILSCESSEQLAKEVRFKAAVLDVRGELPRDPRQVSCAVFLVPQGREHEWLFSSEEGRWELLAGCSVTRLVVVSLERGQDYGDMAAIQAELSPLVTQLAPIVTRMGGAKMNYLTITDGVGKRQCVHQCTSALSGDVVVEDVTLQAEGGPQVFRRMVFLESSNLIQSEALLTSGAGKNKSKSKSKKKAGVGGKMVVDHAHLSCNYHLALSVGTALAGWRAEGPGPVKVLLIGLGGGGLAMFLSQQFHVDLTVVELDPVVERLAKDHFGFAEAAGLASVVGDGLAFVKERARQVEAEAEGGSAAVSASAFDVVIVDASGSAAESISCPPKAFLEAGFLRDLGACLRPAGLMAVNVVSRSQQAFDQAAAALKQHFGSLLCIRAEDDINRVVLGFKGEAANGPALPQLKKEAAAHLKKAQRSQAHQKDLLASIESLVQL